MEKMLAHIFEVVLFAIVARSLIVGPELSDALIVVGLLGAMSFRSFLNKEKDLKLEAIEVKALEMSNKIDLITMKLGIVDARKK